MSDEGEVDSPLANGVESRRFGRQFIAKEPSALPPLESFDIPVKWSYRVKNKLLGPPLVNDQLSEQRLGRPTALAILSSDVMSSSAYATEAMLSVLIPAVGVAAFSLIVPVSLLVVVVLIFVTASYLEVIKAFPKAGGAYIVARETFGVGLAQVAAAALFIDYTLTVAVSISAGADALISAVPALQPFDVAITVFFVVLIAYGNLRGIREAGKSFAIPTFLFIGSMLLMITVGIVRYALGDLHRYSIHQSGSVAIGHAGTGLLIGASLFIVLKSFASGGTALTGTEAISNGVGVFKDPQPRNARITLVAMGLILGTLFVGVSLLASWTHAVPRIFGSPTVVSQIAQAAFGSSPLGHILFLLLDIFTMAILTLAANTSYTGLPFLASFAASDGFLPRRFTVRGHRLVFSSTIIILTVIAIILLVATGSNVNALISLYAIGVFTGFTIAGVGMVKHHFMHKQDNWRRGVLVNGSSAVLSFIVDVVFIVTKFTSGAWLVVVIMPLLVLIFFRFRHRYRAEESVLEEGVTAACEAPILKHHTAFIFVDRVDVATARAIQYARTLTPDEFRAIHIVMDELQAEALEREWAARGLSAIELELVECQDRRLRRAAAQTVLDALYGGETEVSVLLPRRIYSRAWARLLHDRTAEELSEIIGQFPHATAIILPHRVDTRRASIAVLDRVDAHGEVDSSVSHLDPPPGDRVPDAESIGSVAARKRVKVAGRVASIRIQSLDGVPTMAARLEDSSGGLLLVFPGRKAVPGVIPGASLAAWGTAGDMGGHLAILNPYYEFLSASDRGEDLGSQV
ncbi:MAG: APC family permease [Ferrimicrobium sp.]